MSDVVDVAPSSLQDALAEEVTPNESSSTDNEKKETQPNVASSPEAGTEKGLLSTGRM
ncbi:MAG: hypothetical protein GY822_27865 [Deltaproteobacteria bacterium]|nr:hypothetical protein [Deltaproteobacteria bacterium]